MRIRDQLVALAVLAAPACIHNSAVRLSQDADAAKASQGYVLAAEPSVISPGESAVLLWKVPGATKVSVSAGASVGGEFHDIGAFGGSGRLEVQPAEDTTYVITCEGSSTISCASVSVRVRVNRPFRKP